MKAGLTQVEAAQALGISRTAITKWENGDSIPKRHSIATVAKLYGCEPIDLLQGSELAERERCSVALRAMRDKAVYQAREAKNTISRVAWIYSQVGAYEPAEQLDLLDSEEAKRLCDEMLTLQNITEGENE